jgi:Na+/H+ antiporter NhaD/arsenite permease-like protein
MPSELSLWMALPFGLLLVCIALGPLFFANWWSKHYPKVALGLGAITLVYYLFALRATETVLSTGHEYVSFIALIGSLYIVAGGIHINVKGEATPFNNVVFLFLGAVLSNLLGTTGASMLLIRPWLRRNKYRLTAHHVVFFIFIVSNVGGCLTPIGDPPLFLGYLKGIPFWWVLEHCWPFWLVGVGALLVIFYLIDQRNYHQAPKRVREQLAEPPDHWSFQGLGNVFFLAMILGAVFLSHPPLLREALMIVAALGSWFTTRRSIHQANDFEFHPIQEVAVLFIGIFATMMPALDWLKHHAGGMGNPTPGFFYWGSCILSSVLDNAPTYLSFLNAIFGAFLDKDVVAQVHHLVQTGGSDLSAVTGVHAEQIKATFAALQKYHPDLLAAKTVTEDEIDIAFLLGQPAFNQYILALSAGAVLFGACTYIGNGPNFMVKSIAAHQKVRAPTFLGYVFRYTLPYLLPVLLLIWWIFFRQK